MAKTGQSAKTRQKKEEYKEYTEYEFMVGVDAGGKIERLRYLKDTIAAMEKERKDLGADMEAALLVIGQPAVRHGKYLLVRCNGTTETRISRQKLLLNGVDPDVIQSCCEGGKPYTYVQVKVGKEDAEE